VKKDRWRIAEKRGHGRDGPFLSTDHGDTEDLDSLYGFGTRKVVEG
jgi:hypothetical protein